MESVTDHLALTDASQLNMIYDQRREGSGSIVLDDSNL